MKTPESFTTDNDLLSSSLENDVLVIRQKQHIKSLTQDINAIYSFYEYLESILSSKSYKAMVMFACPDKDEYIEYGRFLSKALSARNNNLLIHRLTNAVNHFILTLTKINGITVYAGRGTVSMFHLNLGLAYDYRIVAEDTVFVNPGADIGMITKGSGYFLPRLLGVRKATEVLQWKSFCAEEALDLGLIDLIVPLSKLEEETMKFVSRIWRLRFRPCSASASCSSATRRSFSAAWSWKTGSPKSVFNRLISERPSANTA